MQKRLRHFVGVPVVIHIMWLEVSVAAILEYLIKLKCCFQCCFYTLSKQVNLLHKV